MQPHEIHLEFMKVFVTGSSILSPDTRAKLAVQYANEALKVYMERWPELKEKES